MKVLKIIKSKTKFKMNKLKFKILMLFALPLLGFLTNCEQNKENSLRPDVQKVSLTASTNAEAGTDAFIENTRVRLTIYEGESGTTTIAKSYSEGGTEGQEISNAEFTFDEKRTIDLYLEDGKKYHITQFDVLEGDTGDEIEYQLAQEDIPIDLASPDANLSIKVLLQEYTAKVEPAPEEGPAKKQISFNPEYVTDNKYSFQISFKIKDDSETEVPLAIDKNTKNNYDFKVKLKVNDGKEILHLGEDYNIFNVVEDTDNKTYPSIKITLPNTYEHYINEASDKFFLEVTDVNKKVEDKEYYDVSGALKGSDNDEVTVILEKHPTKKQTTTTTPFISTWTTNPKLASYQHSKDISEEKQIKLPLVPNGSYNFTVDWGDGTSNHITQFDAKQVKHTYENEGTYTIQINGELKGWSFGWLYSKDDKKFSYYGDAEKLIGISSWGDLDFGETEYQFFHAKNMSITATDIPKFSDTRSFKGMFKYAESLKNVPRMDSWDVSNITNMEEMFYNVKQFNEPIGSWDVSNVTNMRKMFSTMKFNQPIGSWDVSNVTNMAMMFYNNEKFNQPIGSWNVSKVTNMQAMFEGDKQFNQPIGSWDVSNVSTMDRMFNNAVSFDKNIGQWNVSKVSDMSNMFSGAELFNQDLNQWNVSNVKNMCSMFSQAFKFNGEISSWDVSNVTDMANMFNGAHSFKGDLSRWDVSQVTSMSHMFYEADSFNADISKWNVSKVVSMFRMFYNASSFDQNIGSWNIILNSGMKEMFYGVTLSTQNYNALLEGFSQKAKLIHQRLQTIPYFKDKPFEFDGGNSKYSPEYKQYRDILTDKYNWTITDGGQTGI